ncbi:MAG: LuxR C-terminal-related transcriptional regulator [Myxococcales bacterium]
MKLDVIGAVEACYADVKNDEAWLSGLLGSVAPLEQGAGSYAQVFQMSRDGTWRARCTVGRGSFRAQTVAEVEKRNNAMPPGLAERLYAPGVKYALHDFPEMRAIGKDMFDEMGCKDALGIISMEPDRTSVVISVFIPKRGRYLPYRTLKQVERYSAHLASAVRLRNAIAESGAFAPASQDRAGAVEAVLNPNGRSLEATGAAREKSACETLADAVRRIEKARGRLRHTGPDEALELWQGLVDGTWSLVDRHDADGKRFLLARRNEPGVKDPVALTRRERCTVAYAAMGHQNKYIAYLLGLPTSKISHYLASARRKLRIRSRAELVNQFASIVQPRP